MIPDRSSDIIRTEPLADEVLYSNVVRIERDRESTGWLAYIGPSFSTGLGRYGASPARALLALAGEMRDKGWVLDESWKDTSRLPWSPNVVVLRKLGPRDWCQWYVQGMGPNDASYMFGDAVIALCGFALRLKERHYLFDADFLFPDPLGTIELPVSETVRG